MKQPPQFVSQLLALVLGWLGAAFVLMGALFTLLHVPLRSGQSWMFSALGLVFLGAAAACLLWAQPAPGQRPAVYLDPEHPRRAFLDPDTLSFLLF